MENLLTRRAALAMAWVGMVSAAGWAPGGVSAALGAEVAVMVRPDVKHQTILGWGASNRLILSGDIETWTGAVVGLQGGAVILLPQSAETM
jgi:hypothetical protein